MKRQFVAGVMGLALAGCAHSRTDVPKAPGAANPAGPVGLHPVPSIHDTVNRGVGNTALTQSALDNPNDPKWAGRAPSPDLNRPGASEAPPPSRPSQSAQMAAAGPGPGQPTQSRSPVTQPTGTPDRLNPSAPMNVAGANPGPAQPTQSGSQATQPTETLDRLNPGPSMDVAAAAAAAGMPAGSAVMTGSSAPPSNQPPQDVASLPPSMAGSLGAAPATGAGGPSPVSSSPSTLERPGGPMPEMLARPGGSEGPSPGTPTVQPAPAVAGVGASPGGPADLEPNGPQVAGPAVNGLQPVGRPPAALSGPAMAPTDPALSPSGGRTDPARGAATTSPKPAGDPLLGPNPDLMPELPPLADAPRTSTPAAASAPAAANPAGTAAAPPAGGPAAPVNDVPPPGPATGPADAPPALAPSGDAAAPASGPPTSPPPELGPPSTDNRPGGSGSAPGAVQVVDLPPLESVPPAGQATGPVAQQTAASASAPRPIRRATARRDGQILRTSAQGPTREGGGPEIRSSWKQASMTAATVGDEIITMQDLRAAIGEHCQRTHTPFASLSREDRNILGPMILRRMIDQSLLIQEAKRTIKNKMYDKFTEEADKFWREEQIPQLEVEFQANNEQQLREKIKDHGRSFETIHQITRQTWMAESFLHAKLKDRIKVDLPELRTYYNAHVHDREFDRPAEIAWREIVVEVGRYPSREEARRKVEALHRSLRDGTDFAALAKAHSDGPSRSREQGGLMQTSPGSYGVATVNEALQALPIGQVSGILEGPSSFHIVRVEGRRAAGPALFEELQDQIRSTLLEKKYQTERAAYIEKLWKETTVSTIFDDTESDPRLFTK